MRLRTFKRAALAVSLSVALAGVAGVPATAESGTTESAVGQWQLIGPNASGGRLAFTQAMPSRLYVLPDRGRSVYRSDDHGLTWSPQAGLGMAGVTGYRLAADPRDPNAVYVAAAGPYGGHGYVLRSNDGARTFQPVLDSPAALADVVVSPSGRDVFAAGTAGVYASSDRGEHWQLLPGSPSSANRLKLDGGDLFVGTSSGVYLIEDALGNPSPAQKLSGPGNLDVENLSVHDGTLVASGFMGGAFLSTDKGRSWTKLTGPWDAHAWIAFTGLTVNGELQLQAIGGATGKNFWVSRDLGRTWTAKPDATPSVDMYGDTGSFPDRPYEEVVAGAAGIYTTHDSATYQRIGVPDTDVESLTVSGSALVAGTDSGSYGSSAPLAKHLPSGYQDWGWTGRVHDTIGNTIRGLVALPGSDTGMLRTRGTYCPDDCFVLERSVDGGASWQPLTVKDGISKSLVVDPRDPSRIYAASYLPAGVYASDDGGKTLELHHAPQLQGVQSVALDSRADGSLWIGDITGLYRSTDSGSTVVKAFDGEVDRIAIDPADPDHIVAVGSKMIKVSHDGGKSFSDAVGVSGLSYDDVTFAPDGTVFAASHDSAYASGQGVFRSVDGGSHWTNVSKDLFNRDVHAVLVSPDGQWLFAGTAGGGVYRLALH
jgi:hypothetical protein